MSSASLDAFLSSHLLAMVDCQGRYAFHLGSLASAHLRSPSMESNVLWGSILELVVKKRRSLSHL